MDEEQLNGLWSTLSPRRLAKYLEAAGEDRQRAINLYLWNAQVGAAFHLGIQTCEVALRNRIEVVLGAMFGDQWYRADGFLKIASKDRHSDIEQACDRIRNRNQAETRDQVAATLSLGFWVGMLEPRYNPPIWGARLREAFPGLPDGRARKSVHMNAQSVLLLRNRLFHHEPLIKMNLSKIHTDLHDLLAWLCPHTSAWVRGEDQVQALLRQKP